MYGQDSFEWTVTMESVHCFIFGLMIVPSGKRKPGKIGIHTKEKGSYKRWALSKSINFYHLSEEFWDFEEISFRGGILNANENKNWKLNFTDSTRKILCLCHFYGRNDCALFLNNFSQKFWYNPHIQLIGLGTSILCGFVQLNYLPVLIVCKWAE